MWGPLKNKMRTTWIHLANKRSNMHSIAMKRRISNHWPSTLMIPLVRWSINTGSLKNQLFKNSFKKPIKTCKCRLGIRDNIYNRSCEAVSSQIQKVQLCNQWNIGQKARYRLRPSNSLKFHETIASISGNCRPFRLQGVQGRLDR